MSHILHPLFFLLIRSCLCFLHTCSSSCKYYRVCMCLSRRGGTQKSSSKQTQTWHNLALNLQMHLSRVLSLGLYTSDTTSPSPPSPFQPLLCSRNTLLSEGSQQCLRVLLPRGQEAQVPCFPQSRHVVHTWACAASSLQEARANRFPLARQAGTELLST